MTAQAAGGLRGLLVCMEPVAVLVLDASIVSDIGASSKNQTLSCANFADNCVVGLHAGAVDVGVSNEVMVASLIFARSLLLWG